MGTARSCHSRRGGYRIPQYVFDDLAEREARQPEREAQEAFLPPKVGRDPDQPYHPLLNPSEEDVARQEQFLRESAERERQRHLTDTQLEHYRKAVDLIKSGGVTSLVDLGSRFQHSYGREKGKCFTATWARSLLKKMVLRGAFTEEQLRSLVPDQTVPKRTRSKQSKAGIYQQREPKP